MLFAANGGDPQYHHRLSANGLLNGGGEYDGDGVWQCVSAGHASSGANWQPTVRLKTATFCQPGTAANQCPSESGTRCRLAQLTR